MKNLRCPTQCSIYDEKFLLSFPPKIQTIKLIFHNKRIHRISAQVIFFPHGPRVKSQHKWNLSFIIMNLQMCVEWGILKWNVCIEYSNLYDMRSFIYLGYTRAIIQNGITKPNKGRVYCYFLQELFFIPKIKFTKFECISFNTIPSYTA